MATKTRQYSDFLIGGGQSDLDLPGKPHIQPGVLYPAVAGKLLDGSTALSASTTGPNSSTVTSSKYGTVQSDGRMYYYTDIKGSKPIKDPRIGAHFGSQRYKFKSLQLLEQETATHGKDVYSIDGREWIRAVGGDLIMQNGVHGHNIFMSNSVTDDTQFVEFTGYFSDANFMSLTNSAKAHQKIYIDGGSLHSTNTGAVTTVSSPLLSRFVDAGSVINMALNQTLGIHTVKMVFTGHAGGHEVYSYGIELIAQDTTSTATKSKIQIPAQNVVSYGKKFALSATAHHYNPFAQSQTGAAVAIGNTSSHGKLAGGWSGTGATYFDDTLDTATSLGLAAWETGGNYYRPVNGGRVVKWIDSSGAIKTSVNMMPPCSTAYTAGSDASLPTSHAWTTVYQPKIKSGAIDHSQAEVAKTFHYREFGNGAANGGTGATYADASMVTASADDIAYVMDDGLTSIAVKGGIVATAPLGLYSNSTNDTLYFTFIGTGFSFISNPNLANTADNSNINITAIQNLPYGTHIVEFTRVSSVTSSTLKVDGKTCVTGWIRFEEVSFHQPKMPPIPEDAVVISDYMLMADFVPQTAGGLGLLSKGVRSNSATRDIFHDDAGGTSYYALSPNLAISPFGMRVNSTANASSATDTIARLPSFGTNYSIRGFDANARHALYVDSDSSISTMTHGSSSGNDSFGHLASAVTLGVHKFGVNAKSGQQFSLNAIEVATPIHTSSHYQTFETPYLHELVGGDRNMEQNNLVVTPDGKSWDEVTRDVSYIGNKSGYVATCDGNGSGFNDAVVRPDAFRGKGGNHSNLDYWYKDWIMAYDRMICLKEGMYHITYTLFSHGNNAPMLAYLTRNAASSATATRIASAFHNLASPTIRAFGILDATVYLKRGDFICAVSDSGSTIHGGTDSMNLFQAERVG